VNINGDHNKQDVRARAVLLNPSTW